MKRIMVLLAVAGCLCGCNNNRDITGGNEEEPVFDALLGFPVKQVSIPRIDNMPNLPQPYKMLPWRQKALDYDSYVFDWNTKDDVRPLIWIDNTRQNVDQETFGLKIPYWTDSLKKCIQNLI
jgi:hypothetical protein